MSSSLDFKFISCLGSWEQFTPFAKGRVVAYVTDSVSLLARTTGYNNGSIHYGYIDEKPRWWSYVEGEEKGYQLHRLLKPIDTERACALTETELGWPIQMRFATKIEVEFVKRAIEAQEAKFEKTPEERIHAILERSLHPETCTT